MDSRGVFTGMKEAKPNHSFIIHSAALRGYSGQDLLPT